jgi:hypothetical protein
MTKEKEGFTMWFKGFQGGLKVIPTQFRIQRYKPLIEITETSTSGEIMKDTLKGVLDTHTLA